MEIYFIIVLLAVGGMGGYLFGLRRKLDDMQSKLAMLQTEVEQLRAVEKRLSEIDKTLAEEAEKEDRELNTLWEELENLRKEALVQAEGGVNSSRWRAFLESRIPSYSIIRDRLDRLMEADAESAAQLQATLPAYLISDEALPGMLDMARMPFERVNWIDALILPVGTRLDGSTESTVEAIFASLLESLGYEFIEPTAGESFKPDLHEIVEQRLSQSARGTVLGTRSRGYRKGVLVVRKARVIVSAGGN